MNHRTLAGVTALALASAGCPKPPVAQPDVAPLPKPEVVLAQIQRQSQARRSLRGEARVTTFGSEGRVRLRVVVVVERPGRFRFETVSPLEQPIDTMASDGERLWLLSKGRLSEGPATPENIARLLPLPLRAEEVVDIMLGGAPISDRFQPVRLEAEGDRWRLHLEGPGRERASLLVDRGAPQVREAETQNAAGVVRLSLRFDDFDQGGLPRSIDVELPERKLEVEIRLKELEVNVELPPTLFRLEPPPGTVPDPLPSPPVAVPG